MHQEDPIKSFRFWLRQMYWNIKRRGLCNVCITRNYQRTIFW